MRLPIAVCIQCAHAPIFAHIYLHLFNGKPRRKPMFFYLLVVGSIALIIPWLQVRVLLGPPTFQGRSFAAFFLSFVPRAPPVRHLSKQARAKWL